MTTFRRILVPHDFSQHASRALEFATRFLSPGGQLVVLHVVVPFVPLADIPPAGMANYITPGELITDAKRQLDATIAKTLPAKLAARTETKVVIGDPYERIIAAARGMDAIVMSTAGRTGLSHLVIGSVAEKVVRHSPVPVVTLRADAAAKAAKRTSRAA
jgi:nucleotide-binding universal stress UspA family protein